MDIKIVRSPLLFSFFAALALFSTCSSAIAAGYSVQSGKVYNAAGQEVPIRGISHFGFNAPLLRPQYLWKMGWKQQIAQIKTLGFTTVRVPFVPATLYDQSTIENSPGDSYVDPALNPELMHKTPLQVLDLWMAEAESQGLYVILDFHSVSKDQQYPTWFVSNPADYHLTYNGQAYTKEQWVADLAFVAQRYANKPHFMGIDIYNEPNGAVRWAASNGAYSWKTAAEYAASSVLAANPNLLIFVQGISDGSESTNSPPINWGENFQPQSTQPLNIANDKLILTPHTYGPDVYVKSSFSNPNFPNNLAADWDTLFGSLRQSNGIVIGEWGGKFGQGPSGQQDVTWQNAFVDYLANRGICNSFYWAYTPNSADTGGILLEDANGAMTVNTAKMDLLNRLWTSCGGASLPVFADAVAPAWQLSGYSSTATIQNTFVKSGTSAVQTVASTYGGVSFDSRDVNWIWTDQPANLYTTLSFDVSAGSTVGAGMSTLEVSLDQGYGTGKKISDYVTSFVANTWYHVEIPLSAMNPQGAAFRKIAFHNNSQTNLTFYVDNVTLLKGSSSQSGQLQSCAKIMSLGDSITHGGGPNGYRGSLSAGLQADNCGVSYVGTLNDQGEAWRHEGHDGLSIGDISNSVDNWLATTQPDIVLLMIGTNNVAWWTNNTAAEIGTFHDALISQIQTARPNAWIFVASIPPESSQMIHILPTGPDTCWNDDHTYSSPCTMGDRAILAQQFNAVIQQKVADRVTDGEKVRFVDIQSVLQQPSDFATDGIHPNATGQAKIGQKFAEAIHAELAH